MKLFELRDVDNTPFDEVQFEKDCAFYLKQMGKYANSLFMLRGSESIRRQINAKNSWQPRKNPVDTPKTIHTKLNKILDERFGHPFRNGMFVNGDAASVGQYGAISIIVPVGEFDWLCNTGFADMYNVLDLYREMNGVTAGNAKFLEDIAKDKNWKHNTDLPGCIKSHHEIMLWCPNGFYMFNEDGRGEFAPRALLKD